MFENRIVVKSKLFVRTFYFDDMVGKVKSSATPYENIRHIVMIWLVRAWLWNIIDFSKVDCTNIFKNIAMIFVGILAVFFGCAVIELFRAKLFDKIEFAVKKLIKAE